MKIENQDLGKYKKIPPVSNSLKYRFFDFVYPEPNTGCWLWGGPQNGHGYGRLYENKNAMAAHRLSLVIHGIPLTTNGVVCHRCNNPGCVNPQHLYVGTHSDNMIQAQRQNRIKGFLHKPRRVRQMLANGNLVNDYDSASDAARITGYSQGTISMACRGERDLAYGYKWQYQN